MTLLLCCHVCPLCVSPRSASCGNTLRYTKLGLAVQARFRGATRRNGASGLGKTKTTNLRCDFGRFGGWAVEGIQMLPVVPASWLHMWHMWHIETRIETQPASAFKAFGSFGCYKELQLAVQVLEDFLKKDWVQNHFLEYKVWQILQNSKVFKDVHLVQNWCVTSKWLGRRCFTRSPAIVILPAANWAGPGWSAFNRWRALTNMTNVMCCASETKWNQTGWWFGTWILFFHILGIIIPTDFHIFQRGWNHQPANDSWHVLVKKKDLSYFGSDTGRSERQGCLRVLAQAWLELLFTLQDGKERHLENRSIIHFNRIFLFHYKL